MQTIASHIINDTDYKAWISDIAGRYRQHQIKAAMHVSDEMIRLYWSIGRDIVEMHVEDRWGQGVLKQLSADLSQELDKKGFSITSLGYMKRFYLLYSEVDGICPQVGGEIEESKLPLCSMLFRRSAHLSALQNMKSSSIFLRQKNWSNI